MREHQYKELIKIEPTIRRQGLKLCLDCEGIYINNYSNQGAGGHTSSAKHKNAIEAKKKQQKLNNEESKHLAINESKTSSHEQEEKNTDSEDSDEEDLNNQYQIHNKRLMPTLLPNIDHIPNTDELKEMIINLHEQSRTAEDYLE